MSGARPSRRLARPDALAPLVVALGALGAAGCGPRCDPATAIFHDVTREAGIAFEMVNGATGARYLLETMVGGVGWIDYDGDGDYDLYLTTGQPDSLHPGGTGPASNRLYRNDGQGRFTDVTEAAGVGNHRYSNGVAVGDYDNDGHSDLLVTNFGRNTLYHNRGDGGFDDVTEAAGLTEPGWNMSATWFDLDRDGDLDLYITRYLVYDPPTARPCHVGSLRVYCHPKLFSGQRDLLYENLGGGRFREVGERAGIAVGGPLVANGLGVIASDFDQDGWVDIYVANDSTPSFLWHNNHDGTFTDRAYAEGVAVNSDGKTQAGMGLDWGDVNGDGRFDIHKTNLAFETNNIYVAQPDGGFVDDVLKANLGMAFYFVGFGTILADFDLDGDLDVAVANGHVDDVVEEGGTQPGVTYKQTPTLRLNDGSGKFSDGAARAGPVFAEKMVGRGLASADYDNDGRLDLAIATIDRGAVLLRNQGGCGQHWLRVRLVGGESGRDAYNARIEARVGSRLQVFEVQSGRSYLSAVDPRPLIGLGSARRVDRLTVRWPSGRVDELTDVEADRELVLREAP